MSSLECRYKSVADNKYHYMEVVGEREYKRACGLGTQFNQEKCICDKDPSYIINKGNPENLHLLFVTLPLFYMCQIMRHKSF